MARHYTVPVQRVERRLLVRHPVHCPECNADLLDSASIVGHFETGVAVYTIDALTLQEEQEAGGDGIAAHAFVLNQDTGDLLDGKDHTHSTCAACGERLPEEDRDA